MVRIAKTAAVMTRQFLSLETSSLMKPVMTTTKFLAMTTKCRSKSGRAEGSYGEDDRNYYDSAGSQSGDFIADKTGDDDDEESSDDDEVQLEEWHHNQAHFMVGAAAVRCDCMFGGFITNLQ